MPLPMPVPPRRLFGAIFAALAVTALLHTHTYAAFQRTRVRLVRAPTTLDAGSALRLTTDDPRLGSLQPPFAVIARLFSTGATADVRVFVDDVQACRLPVVPGRARRYDCAAVSPLTSMPRHTVALQTSAGPITLQYLFAASTIRVWTALVFAPQQRPPGCEGY